MTVRPRADLDQLPAYVAGRSIPGSIKLASNEVSAGPLPTVLQAINRHAAQVHRYPDMGASELTARLADWLGAAPERIAVGCGSVSLCEQLVQAMCAPEDEVVFPWRSFEAYPILTQIAGARQVRVPLTAEHELDLEAILSAITPRTRVVFVCTPNNPTGTALSPGALEAFLDRVPEHVLVALDEAYFEFDDATDAIDGVALALRRDNVLALRTFSKAYGLAGLRVGYAVGPERVVEAVRKVCIPFSVNALAQAAALACVDAGEELGARCGEVVGERSRVLHALRETGYTVPESRANFVWLPLGERTEAFNEHCMQHRVVVRAFQGDGARVTIGATAENDAFLTAARSFAG
ncbi:histidinol-phosphate transaminase [Salinifilum ghardaiensis]